MSTQIRPGKQLAPHRAPSEDDGRATFLGDAFGMAKMTEHRPTLPHILLESIKEQRAVLVFGAGASKECRNTFGEAPPDANQLRDHLAKKFLGTEIETRDLATVAEMAISNGAGEALVFEEVARMMKEYGSSEAHIKITEFRWRGIATTNYDTLIEKAYAKSSNKKQTCIPFVKDNEPYDERLRSEISPVPLLKLHGCLEHRLDRDIPLVLSHEHYHRYKANRSHLFERLRHWAQHSVLIFIGYRLADTHIRSLIYDIDPGRRPEWYIVTPGADEHDRKFYSSKSIEIIEATFGAFAKSLDTQIPEIFRLLARPEDASTAPYTRHFRSFDAASDTLRRSLEVDLEYVHAAIPFSEADPLKFYAGYDLGWGGIIKQYDFTRKSGERLLYDALDETKAKPRRFLLLQGSAGSGKTIALKRAAYNAAQALDQLVLWLRASGKPRAEVFEELYGLTGKTAVLVVDHISLHVDEVHQLLARLEAKNVPLIIIASEREAEWGTYCKRLEADYPPELYTLGRLSEREAEDLVDLLDRHKSLGMLATRSGPERVALFLDGSRSDRQLLVALHELTQGKPFETIIQEEYERILPEAARRLYLDIASMHQFSVMARAGAVSRISGIRFEDFERDFFEPLRDIVRVCTDPFTGDRGYETRHSHVSRIVFGTSCSLDIEKAEQFSRIITGLDAGYSSDKRILEGICKGRALALQFSDIEYARDVFEAAFVAAPESAFLYQQAAILEYVHDAGSLDKAEELATTARSIDSTNHIYLHTLAEVARRKANQTSSRVRAEQLRSQSRAYLNEIWVKNDSRKDLTLCNLLVDESVEMLRWMSDEAKDHEIVEFDAKVDDAIVRLRRARQDFPGEAEFSAVEARLWQKLGDSELAQKALERAVLARPRNSGVFSRLAKLQRTTKGIDDSITTLDQALERFPGDKGIHLQLALTKLELSDPNIGEVEHHLRSSFGAGDHNFDAKFYLGEFLFWQGRVDEARSVFDDIDKRASAGFRTSAPASEDQVTSRLSNYVGSVESRKERFFFIRSGVYPTSIFAHLTSLKDLPYEDLEVGAVVGFRLRFTRKGPVAVAVRCGSGT